MELRTGVNPKHLMDLVIQPTLAILGHDGEDNRAELLLGIAAQESLLGGLGLKQLGDGPALGLWQMEPATHLDIWVNYLRYRAHLMTTLAQMISPRLQDIKVRQIASPTAPDLKYMPADEQLVNNLLYACAMAHYVVKRAPQRLPKRGDIAGYARYWKKHYNTVDGKGTEEDFLRNWRDLIAGRI